MAKWRVNSDCNDVELDQLSIESNSSHSENDQHIQRMNDCSDSQSTTNNANNNRQRMSQRVGNQSNCSQTQRNRSHYSGVHYCNAHQSHHQLHHSTHCSHSSHSSHPNHSNHNHFHHNRNNSHSNHCNQEMSANEEMDSSLASHPSHGLQQQMNYTLDQTEFERIWRQLESNKDRYNFLQSLYRSTGNLVFSEISFGSLGDIVSALYEFDTTVDDFVFVVYILNSLSRAKRFLLSLQFLTLEERVETKKLFIKLWKSMNDIRQDLAENDISELTINALMKSYEIDIE